MLWNVISSFSSFWWVGKPENIEGRFVQQKPLTSAKFSCPTSVGLSSNQYGLPLLYQISVNIARVLVGRKRYSEGLSEWIILILFLECPSKTSNDKKFGNFSLSKIKNFPTFLPRRTCYKFLCGQLNNFDWHVTADDSISHQRKI